MHTVLPVLIRNAPSGPVRSILIHVPRFPCHVTPHRGSSPPLVLPTLVCDNAEISGLSTLEAFSAQSRQDWSSHAQDISAQEIKRVVSLIFFLKLSL